MVLVRLVPFVRQVRVVLFAAVFAGRVRIVILAAVFVRRVRIRFIRGWWSIPSVHLTLDLVRLLGFVSVMSVIVLLAKFVRQVRIVLIVLITGVGNVPQLTLTLLVHVVRDLCGDRHGIADLVLGRVHVEDEHVDDDGADGVVFVLFQVGVHVPGSLGRVRVELPDYIVHLLAAFQSRVDHVDVERPVGIVPQGAGDQVPDGLLVLADGVHHSGRQIFEPAHVRVDVDGPLVSLLVVDDHVVNAHSAAAAGRNVAPGRRFVAFVAGSPPTICLITTLTLMISFLFCFFCF